MQQLDTPDYQLAARKLENPFVHAGKDGGGIGCSIAQSTSATTDGEEATEAEPEDG